MLGVAYFLLDAIATVVVGGTSLFGGRGGIGNTIVGLFVLRVRNNGLDDVKIDNFLKILIRGLILLAALVSNICAERLNTDCGCTAVRRPARQFARLTRRNITDFGLRA